MATETKVLGKIIPTSSQDTYATHDEIYGRGGYRAVTSLEERDAIPTERLKIGMEVRVMDEGKTYYLKSMNPSVWEENKTFNREEDLGIGADDILITDKNFASSFNDLLSSAEFASGFKTLFDKLYKDEVHLGKYVSDTSFVDLANTELNLVNNNLYIDTTTLIIYTSTNGTLSEIGSVATWNDVKGGSQVKFATGAANAYNSDKFVDTIYFAKNSDGTGDIYLNGTSYTNVTVDTELSGTSLNPIANSAVQGAISNLTSKVSQGTVSAVNLQYAAGRLSTSLTFNDGHKVESNFVSLDESANDDAPYIQLASTSGTSVYVTSQESEANISFDMNFYRWVNGTRIEVSEAEITPSIMIEYYAANSQNHTTLSGISSDNLVVNGNSKIDLNKYITETLEEGTAYYVFVTVNVVYQGQTYTKELAYVYTIVSLSLSTSLDGGGLTAAFPDSTDTINIKFNVRGTNRVVSGASVVPYLDGVAQPENTVSGSASSVPVTGITKGPHTIQAVCYYSTGADTIYANSQFYKIYVGTVYESDGPQINVMIPVEGGSVNPAVVGSPVIDVEQFCPYELQYYVIFPEDVEKSTVVFNSLAKLNNTICGEYGVVSNTVSTFTYRYLESGTRACSITCDNSKFDYIVQVSPTKLSLTNPVAGLKVYLDGSGKDNNSRFRDSWEYGAYSTKFSGFQWGNNDGWVTENAQTFLRLVNGAAIDINYQPLSSTNMNVNNSAFTFSTKVRISNIANENEVIMSFLDEGGKGFYLTPKMMSFASTGVLPSQDEVTDSYVSPSIKTVLNKDEAHTITIVVYPYSAPEGVKEHESVAYLYVDGIISGMSSLNIAANTLILNNPVDITCQATQCQLDIYTIRCYNTYCSNNEVLNMYLIDSGDYDLMYSRYDFNNVLSDGVPIKGLNNIPYLIINGSHTNSSNETGPAVEMLKDKDNDKWGIQSIQFVDPADPARNFYCVTTVEDSSQYSTDTCPVVQIQGTSSASYPVKNLKIKLKKGWTYCGLPEKAMMLTNVNYTANEETGAAATTLEYDGKVYENKGKYQIDANSTKETTFTIKVDYAESSGSHNAGTANFVHNLLTASKQYIPPQKMAVDGTSPHTATIRTTCLGRPILLYYRMDEEKSLIFGGKANILNDKSDESVFGFTKIENYTEKFTDKSPDFLASDDYIPLRVVTDSNLAGTVNTIYQESFLDRVISETTDSEGKVVRTSSLSGKTPFKSWKKFVELLTAMSDADKKKWIDLIISEATFKILDKKGAPIQFGFASDIDNKVLLISAGGGIKPLIADSSFDTGITEISGLAVKDDNTLYAVSDTSGLYKIDLTTKTSTQVNSIGNRDCEGVSVNSLGNIVVAVEGTFNDSDHRSDADTQCIYTLEDESATPVAVTNAGFASFLEAENANSEGKGRGFEAVCHYSDDIIFIGNQTKPKEVVVYDIANSSILAAVELKKVAGLYEEIADFDYNPSTKELFILDSDLGTITVWKVANNSGTWTFTRDESKTYKCPTETLVDTDANANPEGLAVRGNTFYISDENGDKLYVCSVGTPVDTYNLTARQENPIQCWEFRTNDDDRGFFLNTDFSLEAESSWFNNVWESRFPDDTDSNNAEYKGGRIPYSLYTIANWIASTNRYLPELTELQKEERAAKFVNELPLYFNVDMLCSYYMITDVLAAADQRVKNMMWAFYLEPSIDPEKDIMHGLRVYPIFYDNDTILGVNNSGILFDPVSGTLTLPWDCDHDTTCAASGYSGHTESTRANQYSFSGHDSVIWINLRELCADKLQEAYLRFTDDTNTTKLSTEHILHVYDDQFTALYPEVVFNLDAVKKYVNPKIGAHYPKAQGSREAHRHWFLSNRLRMFNAKYDKFDAGYLHFKGGADYNAGNHAQVTVTMDHDWWTTWRNGDTGERPHTAIAQGVPVTNEFYDLFGQKSPGVGSTIDIYGLEHARELEINWDSATECAFTNMADGNLSALTKFTLTSKKTPATVTPDLNSKAPNLEYVKFDGIAIGTEGINITKLVKLKDLIFTNCTNNCNQIALPEGGFLEHLHLPNIAETSLRFVNLPKLSNEGIEFDSEEGWNNVTSLLVSNCPNIDALQLFNKVKDSVRRVYLTGVEMEGDGSDLKLLKEHGVKGYDDDLVTTNDTICSIYGTYKLTTLLSPAEYDELQDYFKGLEIKNLEYSLYKFQMGSNASAPVLVTNMETGKSGNDPDYAPTGHAKAILDKRNGYLIKPKDGDTSTGDFVATVLSPLNHTEFPNGSSADLSGASGDYMIYEPEYWYKGVNDFANNAVYAAFSATEPTKPTYTTISTTDFGSSAILNPSEFNNTSTFLVNYSIDTALGIKKLTVSPDNNGFNTYYYVLPANHKFRRYRVVSTINDLGRGAVVIDRDQNIIQRLSAPATSGMYPGAYLVGNLAECTETPYAIVFTTPKTISGDLLVLSTSSDMMDLEDWTKHEETFVGRSYSVPESLGQGNIISRVYGNSNNLYTTQDFTMRIDNVNASIKRRGVSYTTFDYELFKDTMNLAFIKYGTTDLDSITGTGLSTGSIGGSTASYEWSLASRGMADTLTNGSGSSYFVNENTGADEATYNPLIMGYEKLTGCGNSCSINDSIKVGSNYALVNSRTNRTIALYPSKASAAINTLIYPVVGKWLDLLNNSNAGNAGDISTEKVGFCGTIVTANSTNGSYSNGYLTIGKLNPPSSKNTPHMIYMEARVASSIPQMSVSVTLRSGLTNAVRLMIVPNHVEFVSSNDY